MPRTGPPLPLPLAALLAVVALAAGCGSDDSTSGGSGAGDPAAVRATTRSLVAATADHLGRPAKIAAPLFASDLSYDHPDRVAEGTLAVEVAFDEEEGDNSHVTLVVTPFEQRYADLECGRGELRLGTCEESTTDDGAQVFLVSSAGYPEEDPGSLHALAVREDRVVSARYSGELVPRRLEGSDLAGLADDLVSLVGDPAVGFETSEAYAEAGEEIDDEVVLDWFGQGNGFPPPPEYREEKS